MSFHKYYITSISNLCSRHKDQLTSLEITISYTGGRNHFPNPFLVSEINVQRQ